MNINIKQLAEQAHDYTNNLISSGGWENGDEIFEEKFAELIIRECASFKEELTQFDSSTAYGDGYEQGLKDVTETFLEHFGVEE